MFVAMSLMILILFDLLFTYRNTDFQKGTTPEEIQGAMDLGLWVDATDRGSFVIAI
jgi:hypothetical protein